MRPRTHVLLILLIVILSGCGYPEVSDKTYELSKALYTACNLKNEDQLTKVDELIKSNLTSGEITKREANWLKEISQQAHTGDWKAAAHEARQLMEDQVK